MIVPRFYPKYSFQATDFTWLRELKGLEHVNLVQADDECTGDVSAGFDNMVGYLRPWQSGVEFTAVTEIKG